jgi:DNA polymerase elongation subunit (family B)
MGKLIISATEQSEHITFRMRIDGKEVYKRIPFNNYFYIKKEDYDGEAKNIVKKYMRSFEEVEDAFGEEFIKITLKDNLRRYQLKKDFDEEMFNFQIYEIDISAVQRFMVNNDMSDYYDYSELRVACFDIETRDVKPLEKNFDGDIIANDVVLSCAIGDQKGTVDDVKYFFNKNPDDPACEKELLTEIFDELRKYDVITGWNSLDFDAPYLKQRQKLHELENCFDWNYINVMDDMVIFKKFYDKEYKSYSLNNVAKQLLKDEKINLDVDAEEDGKKRYKPGMYYESFRNNPELFKKYNIQDVVLLQKIEAKTKNHEPKKALAKITQSFLQDTNWNSVLVDNMYLRKCHLGNIISNSKPSAYEKKARKNALVPGGGYTFCYEPGVHDNLEVFDYKSHYPLIMTTFNISPEIFVNNGKIDDEELKRVLSKEELDLMNFSIGSTKNHVGADGRMKPSYDKAIEQYAKEKGYNFTMVDVMFKFTDKYTGDWLRPIAEKGDYIFTPADLNRDTHGWCLHPHRFFKRKMGVFPLILQEVLDERDKTKYRMRQKAKEDVNFIGSDEYNTMNYYQIAMKLAGNSVYGTLGAVHTRIYNYGVSDTVTSCGRWILKKSILYARKKGYEIVSGDTDSLLLLIGGNNNEERLKRVDELNKDFYDYYKELFSRYNTVFRKTFKNPRTKQEEELPYWCVFEWEHTYPRIIIVAKKRYYFLEEFKDEEGHVRQEVATRGGAFLKNDTNPLGAKLQKELCTDILKKVYDRNYWVKKINVYKEACFEQKLAIKHLVQSKKYTKNHTEFGGVMLDKMTKLPKINKDGEERWSNVPVHIKMVRRLEALGKVYQVGETIDYIIAKPKINKVTKIFNGKEREFEVVSKTQSGITPEEYEMGEQYDAEVYWKKIISPITEILMVTDKKAVFEEYKDCWGMTPRALENAHKKMLEEDDVEEKSY